MVLPILSRFVQKGCLDRTHRTVAIFSHGLPTRPQVTREVADGTYLMEGMKFSMIGWWEIKLAIQAAEGADTAVFNTVVGASGLQR